MFSCNICVGIKVKSGIYHRTQKLWVDRVLTSFYRRTGRVPDVGFTLKTGDVVISKGSDDTSIILFITKNKKKNERTVCKKV